MANKISALSAILAGFFNGFFKWITSDQKQYDNKNKKLGFSSNKQ
jgi:hypothetical protein